MWLVIRASLEASSVGKPSIDAMMSTIVLLVIAGMLPVEAITSAPSAPLTNLTKSQAASLLGADVGTARAVIVERVEPGSTPSA